MTNSNLDKANQEAWEQRLIDLQSSYKNALETLALAEALNYDKGIADSCKVLGYCFWRFSDYSHSLSHSMRALKIFKKNGDLKNEADTLNNIGAVYMFQNDNIKRLEVNIKCRDIRKQIGDLEGVISSEGNIGETYFEMGDLVNAKIRFESVLKDINASPQGIAWAYHNIGKIYGSEKNWEKALKLYLKALEVSNSVNYNVLIVDSYIEITQLYLNQQKYKEAVINGELALQKSKKIGAKDGEKKALYFLFKIFEEQALYEVSLKYHKRYHKVELEISHDTEVERLKTAQLKVAFDKIEEQKNELVDSIRYAERIQKALLTSDLQQKLLSDFFVFYKPKDIVSGDFYWYFERDEHFYLGVADCTGHGVPGAFLTMLGTTFLNEIITTEECISPSHILDQLRSKVIKSLSQSSEKGNKDGMDISLIKVNTRTNIAEWAGAYNPLLILRSSHFNNLNTKSIFNLLSNDTHNLFEIKADKAPISISERMSEFTNHVIQLEKGDNIYLFSDGFSDQFGGKSGKKFLSRNFKKLLLKIQNYSIPEQAELIENQFVQWKGHVEQLDDVCVLGFKL
jgi:serine phosphatase RsbU (regulator of sigma subunit)